MASQHQAEHPLNHPLEVFQDFEWPEAAPKSLLGSALLTSCLALGATAGLVTWVPALAQAQVQVVPSPKPNSTIRRLNASSLATGKIPTGSVAERLQQLRPEVRTHLGRQPLEVQRSYLDLDSNARQWLSKQIDGSSPTLLGKVKHRPAFISGRVMFVNLFEAMKAEIRAEARKGHISKEAQQRISLYLDELKQMQPAQREALADTLHLEFASDTP